MARGSTTVLRMLLNFKPPIGTSHHSRRFPRCCLQSLSPFPALTGGHYSDFYDKTPYKLEPRTITRLRLASLLSTTSLSLFSTLAESLICSFRCGAVSRCVNLACLFTLSPVSRHSGCVQFLAITNQAASMAKCFCG